MRIMWLSNAPWTPSGYGQQTRIFVPRLVRLGHEIAVTCFHGLEGGVINMGDFVCYPKHRHPYGNDIAFSHAMHFRADVMISLMDTWVMNPEDYPRGFRWIPWYPVDHDPMPMIVRGKISQAYKRITFSKFGVEKTHEAGLDCYYIPHGVETQVYKQMDKAQCRQNMGLPQDKYIVGTVAMNKGVPSRKCFTEQVEAFSRFHKRHPDSIYIIQTDSGHDQDGMINIPELVQFFGMELGKDVILPDQYMQKVGYPVDYLAQVYNCMDVLLMATRGEGFGIPQLEAQACGVPVIAGGWTASRELHFAGQLLDPDEDADREYSGLASYQFRPRIDAIERALEQEYAYPSDGAKAAEKAKEYDADLVVEQYWKPTLDEIQGGLTI